MPLCKPEDLLKLCPKPSRLLGLDYGEAVIGVAVADPSWRIASPIGVVQRKNFGADLGALLTFIRKQDAKGIVIGLPLNLDGSEGPAAEKVRKFADGLAKNLPDLSLTFSDERLSTAAVERAMVDADLSRKKRDHKIDAAAAAYILQGFLDRMGNA